MTNDNDLPAAPPPLAAWWGRTGLLYVGLSVLGAIAERVVAQLNSGSSRRSRGWWPAAPSWV